MSITPAQVQLVKDSWAMVVPIADDAVQLFYNRLFELNPGLTALFKSDMAEQRRKLATMLGTAVASLDRLETIVSAVQALGERHAGYGVKPADYDTVAAALLWTLEQGLGEAFTPDIREAWTETYVILATTMQEAAAARTA